MSDVAVVDKATGRCIQVYRGALECSDEHLDPEHFLQPVQDGFDGAAFYFDGTEPVAFPSKPSTYHRWSWETKQWLDPRTNETQWAVIRTQRSKLLTSCDWTQLPDVPGSTQAAWSNYRKALRDITNQSDPFNINWPENP